MSVENLIGDLELALVKLLRYGLLTRYAAAADLTALAATVGQSDGALRYVTSVSALFEWYPYISTTPNGTTVIAVQSTSLSSTIVSFTSFFGTVFFTTISG